mgnify:CR=1 FL=1
MGLILCVIFIAVGHRVDSVTEATSCLQHGRTIEILTVCLWTRPPLTMYFGKIPIQLCGQACLHCRLASACVWGGASVWFLLCTQIGRGARTWETVAVLELALLEEMAGSRNPRAASVWCHSFTGFYYRRCFPVV